MPNKLPWFPFYPSDFLLDEKVAEMTTLQCGAYIRLLCHAWNRHPKGTLPCNPQVLARMAYMTDDEWDQHKDKILAPFERIGALWHQKRMMAEGTASEEKHEIFVESGRRGGLASKALRHPTRQPTSEPGSNHNHNHNTE